MLKNQEDTLTSVLRGAKENATKKGEVFFRPISLGQLMEIEFPKNYWIVQDLIPAAGITALSGQPASYKTWVLLSIAMAVSSGEHLFGQFDTDKTSVLIVDEESGARRLQQRLLALDIPDTLPIYFWALQNFKIEEKHINKLIEYCEEQNVGLVILDSLVRLHGQDENDAVHMAQVLQLLKKCTTQGITILFAHHNRKPGAGKNSDNLSHAMRGSSDILAAVDCHIALTRSEHRLIINQTKSRDSEELAPVELDVVVTDGKFNIEYRGTLEKPQSKAKKAEAAIVEALTQRPNLNQKELLAELATLGFEIGIKTLQKALSDMVASGLLNRLPGSRNANLYQVNMELADA